MTKGKVLRILNRYLNKPRDYHFFCYGGGSVPMINIWSPENTYKCKYQDDKNWMTPLCETCTGLTQKERKLPNNEMMENYLLKRFAETIIQELENE